MTRLLLVGDVIAADLPLAGTAHAVCDPKYRPLCASDCPGGTPDVKHPTDLSWLIRVCPD